MSARAAAGVGALAAILALASLTAPLDWGGRAGAQGPEGGAETVVVRSSRALGVPVHRAFGEREVAARIPNGSRVRILRWSPDRRWLEVEGGGARGFITARYVVGDGARPTGAGEAPRDARAEAVDPSSPFASAEACVRDLRRTPRTGPPRLATWNVRWFPDGRADGELADDAGTDVVWLACAIASLRVDLIALQEIVQHERGQRALAALLAELGRLTGARWRAELDRCPRDGRQHVGFLYREDRVTLDEVQVRGELNPGRSACDHRLRPGLLVHARFARGRGAYVLNVHLDSGVTARDARNRALSAERIAALARELGARDVGRALVVLGDFNSMGCEECEPRSSAAAEQARLAARLGASAVDLERLGDAAQCTENDGRHREALDHVFARRGMALGPGAAAVAGPCATSCASGASRMPFFHRLSDHCPMVLELAASASR
jgi:endonuclease/exonuclease/phosphatase family metal-dependent hydrolase